jgi:molybdate/tungstate transport system substrate-binding protein
MKILAYQKILICSVLVIMLSIIFPGCKVTETVTLLKTTGKSKLVIFEAGSLMVPFAQLEKEFEAANPDIDVQIQAHGSIQVIRHVTELGMDIDLVAVADYSLIPLLMYETKMSDGRPYADWYIEPATNELVVAYSPTSKYASEINSDNWYQILARPDVRIALADPRMDAVGYRALMITVLSQNYYNQTNIMRNILGDCFSTPITEYSGNGVSLITVPEILEPSNNRMSLRGASMECINLIESGAVDYTFEYKSVVRQHNLKYIELPPQINLGDATYTKDYSKVRIKLDFRRFQSVTPIFDGVQCIYGVAIPNNSIRQDNAVKFIQFMLGPDGQRIFSENHQPPLSPPVCDNVNALPEGLKTFFK